MHNGPGHGPHHRRAADPTPHARQLCPDAVGTLSGTDDGHHAVVARLITEPADFSVSLPNFDFVSGDVTLRFCDGLLVAIAIKISRIDNSVVVVEEIQTVVCHTPSVVALCTACSAGAISGGFRTL